MYIRTPSVAVAAAVLMLGVLAAEYDSAYQFEQAFQNGLLPRKDDANANLNVRVNAVYR